ncbi:Flagellar motor switch protein FliM [Buchnera aphidicola (Thelaxes suberi)]|uniref:FliM/FliN family flagellar motor C-terminal domain-containing protein n=1 Tax=Buchnera aphidicola TaxID=9 RepID=UPI00346488C8
MSKSINTPLFSLQKIIKQKKIFFLCNKKNKNKKNIFLYDPNINILHVQKILKMLYKDSKCFANIIEKTISKTFCSEIKLSLCDMYIDNFYYNKKMFFYEENIFPLHFTYTEIQSCNSYLIVMFPIVFIQSMISYLLCINNVNMNQLEKNFFDSHTYKYFTKKIISLITKKYISYLSDKLYLKLNKFILKFNYNFNNFSYFIQKSDYIRLKYNIKMNCICSSFFILIPFTCIKNLCPSLQLHNKKLLNTNCLEKKNSFIIDDFKDIKIIISGRIYTVTCMLSDLCNLKIGDVIPISNLNTMFLFAGNILIASGKIYTLKKFYSCCIKKIY